MGCRSYVHYYEHLLLLPALTLIHACRRRLQGLQEVLKQTDATGKMRIIQQMSINIIPIVEKGLLDPVVTHGWAQCQQKLSAFGPHLQHIAYTTTLCATNRPAGSV